MSDYRMPGMDGVAFLKAIRALQPQAVRLVLSAQADQSALISAINEAQILRFLAKPWSEEELVNTLRLALETHDRQAEEHQLADKARLEAGKMSRQEFELRRLEQAEPGITKVKWGPDGSVLIDED
jgi:response regulator RpfG family c-di-GMP phosphodiesterase